MDPRSKEPYLTLEQIRAYLGLPYSTKCVEHTICTHDLDKQPYDTKMLKMYDAPSWEHYVSLSGKNGGDGMFTSRVAVEFVKRNEFLKKLRSLWKTARILKEVAAFGELHFVICKPVDSGVLSDLDYGIFFSFFRDEPVVVERALEAALQKLKIEGVAIETT